MAVSQPFHSRSMHNWPVPLRAIAAAVAGLFLAVPASATEKPKPTTSQSPVGKPAPTESHAVHGRTAKDAAQARKAAIATINQTFTAAVQRAQNEYKAARAVAKTADAKGAAEANRKAGIAAAAAARQKAIDALGPAPSKSGSTSSS